MYTQVEPLSGISDSKLQSANWSRCNLLGGKHVWLTFSKKHFTSEIRLLSFMLLTTHDYCKNKVQCHDFLAKIANHKAYQTLI